MSLSSAIGRVLSGEGGIPGYYPFSQCYLDFLLSDYLIQHTCVLSSKYLTYYAKGEHH